MAFTTKTLGQANPGAALTALYTVPGGGQTTLSVTICNTGVFAESYRVSVAPAGAVDHVKQYLAYDTVVAANTTNRIDNIQLRAGDVVRVYASNTSVSFTAMGLEST
jgi:hypothetical protein